MLLRIDERRTESRGGFRSRPDRDLARERSYFCRRNRDRRREREAALAETGSRAATQEERDAAELVVKRTAASMGREMRSDDLRELLSRNLEHPRWDDVAERCLTCGNCTMVCPTCFCTSVEDSSDLTGAESSRSRRWDSCFTMDFSYIHGGSVRASAHARYRQWMTHKLATWIDQFGIFRLRRLRPLHHLVPGRDRHHRRGASDPRQRAE